MFFTRPTLGLLVCLLSACSPLAAGDSRPDMPLPARYAEAPASTGLAESGAWWKTFRNTELDTLIATALEGSFDIKTAWARLRQAEAVARKAGADVYPALDLANTSAARQRRGGNTVSETDTVSLGLAASYEIDLWGRIAATRDAERFRTQASHADLESAFMTVAASVADTWIALVGAQAELAVLDRQIETNAMLTQTLALRFANAMSSGLDVLQQQELLVAAQAERPSLEMEIQTLHTKLAVLLGLMPGNEPKSTTTELPALPPLPAPGLPADLLVARPDIRAAWERLSASRRDVGAAQASRLPAVRLSASGTFSGENSGLFSNWLLNLAAGLSAPLFDGGKLSAETDRMRAIVDEQVQTYGKTVADALKEAEDALSNETRQQARLLKLQEQLRYAEVAREESRTSYFGGRDTFLRYITQLQSVQKQERNVIREQATLLRYRIALHRALGGDWTRRLVADANTTLR